MTIRRRHFLAGALAAGVPLGRLHAAGLAAPTADWPELRAAVSRQQLAPADFPDTEIWAYNGSSPGPEIRLPRGARLQRRLVNALPEETSIHWHGLRVPNAMDGVPGLTQDAVQPGESFDYAFDLPDAGTFWYHTHNRSWEQMARGLHGPLIVEEETAPDVDRELVLVLDDWRLTRDGAHSDDFGALHDFAHAGRLGNLITINGTMEPRHSVKPGERLRLRLINSATARVFTLGFKGLEGWIMATDGMPLETPEALPEQIALAPAQRLDLFVDVTGPAGEEAFIVGIERQGGFALASFDVGQGSATRRPAPEALPPNDLPAPDLAAARSVRIAMEGGAMRGLGTAIYEGREMSGRELVGVGQVWALSGYAGMPEAPLATLARGETLRIPLKNDTMFPHAMHMHGHHFREIRADGSLGAWRDTTLVAPGEEREIIFVADNPGKWLFHCHMLGHQASGMKTWFEVAA